MITPSRLALVGPPNLVGIFGEVDDERRVGDLDRDLEDRAVVLLLGELEAALWQPLERFERDLLAIVHEMPERRLERRLAIFPHELDEAALADPDRGDPRP